MEPYTIPHPHRSSFASPLTMRRRSRREQATRGGTDRASRPSEWREDGRGKGQQVSDQRPASFPEKYEALVARTGVTLHRSEALLAAAHEALHKAHLALLRAHMLRESGRRESEQETLMDDYPDLLG